MPDDLEKRGPADRARIKVNEDHEVLYWSEEFEITPERLRDLVRSVGPLVDDVRQAVGNEGLLSRLQD
jgi:hypothetical protein